MTKTTTTAQQNRTPAVAEVHHLDPRTLLVDVNIRQVDQVDEDFVASIRENGVLLPIVAQQSADGVRVRLGHRRTLAAVRAGLPTVPVYLHPQGDTDEDDAAQAGEVERVVSQWAENEHRAGLTRTEQVRAVEQLAAFGLSATQIATRTKAPRARVDAALQVSRSDLALAATDRYDFLDLTQAAVLAEFEDDPETVKALVVAAQRGQFDHAAQRARDERQQQQERAAYAATLTEQGLTVVEAPAYGSPEAQPVRLVDLTDDPDTRTPLTVEDHATCPGHAVYVGTQWVWHDEHLDDEDDEDLDHEAEHDEDDEEEDREDIPRVQTRERVLTAVAVCTAPTEHGHQRRYATREQTPTQDKTDEQREAARAERRDVIESNKAWRSAETVRHDFLTTLAQRKTPPKGTAAFLAASLARHGEQVADVKGNHLAADLLGVTRPAYGRSTEVADLTERATDGRCLVIALVQVLAAYEAHTHLASWRNVSPAATAYLGFLAEHGYALSDVEKRAAGQQVETLDS